MSDPLVVLSDTKNIVSQGIIVIDYDKVHHFCRHGLWEGFQQVYTETVTLAYEHTVEEYVGWRVNGTVVVDPGYSAGTPPWGAPLPGFPSVRFACPVGGYYHQISFTSSANDPVEKFWVQAIYRTNAQEQVPIDGPGTWVTLSGQYVDWPWFLLQQQEECLEHWIELINSVRAIIGGFAPVSPGDPVEWAAQFTPEEASRLKAGLAILEKLDAERQPELAQRVAADVNDIVQFRTVDASGLYGLDSGTKRGM
jgi:hypothetical protein